MTSNGRKARGNAAWTSIWQAARSLITGASKGIGRAVAEVLAREGCALHPRLAHRGGPGTRARRDPRRIHNVPVDDPRRRPIARPQAIAAVVEKCPDDRHPDQQCRRDPEGRPARAGGRALARGLGAEGLRLHQHVPRLLPPHAGAAVRRHHQHHRASRPRSSTTTTSRARPAMPGWSRSRARSGA